MAKNNQQLATDNKALVAENKKLTAQIKKLSNSNEKLVDENSTLSDRVEELEAQLQEATPGAKKPVRTEDWENELDQLIEDHPKEVESMIRTRFGLPNDYSQEKLTDVAHARARSNHPQDFVSQLKHQINASHSNK